MLSKNRSCSLDLFNVLCVYLNGKKQKPNISIIFTGKLSNYDQKLIKGLDFRNLVVKKSFNQSPNKVPLGPTNQFK